ncbi:carbamoyltransferase HypF [Neobacillus sp. MM2021_6]|uniref:carbamoyltransferase HypF n=1 Tax=Bacillaceae TaxID=186817 RepID=UPI00140A02AC|nr:MULTISPECIES: carbamoyltransferase HypF [Bacillaceae]MBO0958273.1 carbamoyltransferase HypF [Neobacillus sp. MM2021_6]NHC17873.1 carbamoyltransferase HypF [Bacillus sp. MM2020_4]
MHSAVKIAVRGRVQGVGFRPFVFQLADRYQLYGTVQNNMDGVKIHIEGNEKRIRLFLADLKDNAPRLSKIQAVLVEETKLLNLSDFTIIPSERNGTSMLVIPTDSAVCDDCLNEMNDPTDFRYQYPFINCTQCGPRYTIIEELPYDRPYTSMKNFPMCDDCRREYEDPTNRRHHAQPIACPTCGPKVRLRDGGGLKVVSENPIRTTIQLLKKGKIVAIKGIGGYHLCCDARNEPAVAELRKRKSRPVRPLAVMAASISTAEDLAVLGQDEQNLLKSPEAPIVILKKQEQYPLAESVAPGMGTIGVMLPYTPLHHLLLTDPELDCIVATSANPSGMPILYRDKEAFHYLAGIADFYLVHNREILHPVDDSVVQINNGKLDFLRRARGYVPDPSSTKRDVTGIVAFGGQQKTTFSIGRNEQVFVGPHIGDLENIETIDHYKQELEHLLKWIDIPKTTAVIDVHPDYHVQKLVKDYEFNKVMEVQHHHAHLAACIEEHQIPGKAYGIILDGTGYGLDGNLWGFEILYGDALGFVRMAHLHYTPLPGGEKCIREPWRNAAAMLISHHGEIGMALAKAIFADKSAEIDILEAMIRKSVNTVYGGTCGRLFDAVSALCGVTKVSSYDGEAAIRLAEMADEGVIYEPYQFELIDKEMKIINFSKTLKEVALDVLAGMDVHFISGRFHETVVQAIVSAMVELDRNDPDLEKTVALSGGSFHNRYLRKRISAELNERSFRVFVPEKVPCNDGGLSYGQLVVAAAKRSANQCVLEYQQK